MRLTFILIMAFALTACGGGSDSGNSSISSSPPTIEISLSKAKSYVGENVTIKWNSTNTNTCIAENAWSGVKPPSGEEPFIFEDDGLYVFELRCTRGNQNVTASRTIRVFKYNKLLTENMDESSVTFTGDATSISIPGDGLAGNIPPTGIYYTTLDFRNIEIANSFNNDVTMTVFQSSYGEFDYTFNGVLFGGQIYNNFNINLSESSLKSPLQRHNDLINFASPTVSRTMVREAERYNNAILEALKFYTAYTDEQIDTGVPIYADGALIEVQLYDDSRFMIATYGDKTDLEDIPVAGTREIPFSIASYWYNSNATHEGSATWGFNNTYAVVGDFQDALVAFGSGALVFDFDMSTVTGSLTTPTTLNIFQHLPTLRESYDYTGDGDSVFTVNDNANAVIDTTFTIENGVIINNSFVADIRTSEGVIGQIYGSFYGPDASEIGFNLLVHDTPGSTDYSLIMGFGLGV